MRQPINFTKTKLDELADKAVELHDWLEKNATEAVNGITIPPQVVTVTSVVVVVGLTLIVDQAIPDSTCWAGCRF